MREINAKTHVWLSIMFCSLYALGNHVLPSNNIQHNGVVNRESGHTHGVT